MITISLFITIKNRVARDDFCAAVSRVKFDRLEYVYLARSSLPAERPARKWAVGFRVA